MYKFFTEKEVAGLQIALVKLLDEARGIANIPFYLTSTIRSPQHNAEVGGVADSSHLKGLAVDIRAELGSEKWKIINALLAVGFQRLGIYDHHIHADIDKLKPQNVIWRG